MTEVTNINSMSKSEIEKYNKEVAELQQSIQQLTNLKSALENKIQVSDNSIISTIISQIESTKQFAIKTIESGQITQESNREILRDSYETIQNLLKENRKESLINSNNQIVTLKEILREYKEEQDNLRKESKKNIDNHIEVNKEQQNLIDEESVERAKKAASISLDVLSSTPMGTLLKSSISSAKQIYEVLKDKRNSGSKKSLGTSINSLYNSPISTIKEARSLERKEKKETNIYRKKVINKLEELTDEVKEASKSSDSGTSNFLLNHPLLSGGLLAGAATLFWKSFLSDENKEKIKKFIKDSVIDPITKLLEDKFPAIKKVNEYKKAFNNEGIYEGMDEAAEIPVNDSDNFLVKMIKGQINKYRKLGSSVAKMVAVNNELTENPLSKDKVSVQDSKIPNSKIPNRKIPNNEIEILKHLKSKGFTDQEAAGIYGNIIQESKGNPLEFNKAGGSKGAFGLFQWRGARQTDLKEFAEKRGLDYKDWKTQIDFAIQEEGGKISPETLHKLNYKSSDDYARYVRDKFERSGETDKDYGGYQRLIYARQGEQKLAELNNIKIANTDNPPKNTSWASNLPKAKMYEPIYKANIIPSNDIINNEIQSADSSMLQLSNNQLLHDKDTNLDIIDNDNKNYSNISQLAGTFSNILNNGFSNLSESIKNPLYSINNSNIDDPAMIALNSGSI